MTYDHGDHFDEFTSRILVEKSSCLFVMPESCLPVVRRLKIPDLTKVRDALIQASRLGGDERRKISENLRKLGKQYRWEEQEKVLLELYDKTVRG